MLGGSGRTASSSRRIPSVHIRGFVVKRSYSGASTSGTSCSGSLRPKPRVEPKISQSSSTTLVSAWRATT